MCKLLQQTCHQKSDTSDLDCLPSTSANHDIASAPEYFACFLARLSQTTIVFRPQIGDIANEARYCPRRSLTRLVVRRASAVGRQAHHRSRRWGRTPALCARGVIQSSTGKNEKICKDGVKAQEASEK